MARQMRGLYDFGPFHLDAANRTLLKDGEIVPLTPKAFDTLLVLVVNRGRLVEKQELMKAVWPDSFVEENNLNRSIYLLRKALGESSGQARYIETVPKHGYRFVASVRELESNDADLVLEKHTTAEIITEEEEIIHSNGSAPERPSYRDPSMIEPASSRRLIPALRWRPVAVLGAVAVIAIAALIFLWSLERLNRMAKAKVKSIAVLPFENLGPGSDDEHLS